MLKMSKRNFTYIFRMLLAFVTLVLLTYCQKVINIDLNSAAPRIVIDALITDRPGPYTILITKSGSYFNQPVLPPVTGAEVTITDDRGTIDTLLETKQGLYMTKNLRGIPGMTYTLKVISDNTEYSGTSTMYSHVRIDSINLTKSDSFRFGLGGGANEVKRVDVNCFFKDPEEKNFYRLKVTGSSDTTLGGNYRLYDDQYTNGQEIELRAARAKAGDTIKIELYSLDNSTYGYYRTLEDLLQTNPFFGSTPANPNTNLSNGALGYFGASAVSSKNIIITDSLFNSAR
jgi:hypothetical protein